MADRRVVVDLNSMTWKASPPIRGRSPSTGFGGLVIVVNGPSSVGKSTLMRTFADRAVTPSRALMNRRSDDLQRNSGRPSTLGLTLMESLLASWQPLDGNQFVLSAAGIRQARFESALADVGGRRGTDGALDTLVQRQLGQVHQFGGLAEESMGIDDGWHYDLRIETVDERPDAAARFRRLRAERCGGTP